MERKTELSRTLINSYRTAHYRVVTGHSVSFTLKIKKKSPELEALLQNQNLASAAFVTAFNRHGRQTDRNINAREQKALLGDIRRTGLPFWEGFVEDPAGKWKSEPSFLVLGISQGDAEAMGRKYGQNAIVWAEDDAVPQLILLR